MNITEKAKKIADSCRFCWMCRHVCPIGNATGLERNTARARALGVSLVGRGAEDISEITDNIYECTLCGACTNNCVTGWDPKVFVQEVKTEIVLGGKTPDYIFGLLDNYAKSGNIYGATACKCLDELYAEGDTLLFVGENALYKSPESVKNAVEVLKKARVNYALTKGQSSGASLWFLTGKTAETMEAAKKCADQLNKYATVVVYDPEDLKFMLHEYREWGINIKANLISFNEYLLNLLESGKIVVKKTDREYTLQDNYAYARDLDDTETGRKLIEKVGKNKEMLLIGKEANLAGHLIMNEYMPEVMKKVALNRWVNACNMDCKTIVTENPAEYVALKATCPEGREVISVEEMILRSLV
ncbi:MAG: (Fe-S)-binding protein [Clostridia bacterium]|nr:(Fe-S)-binding protein [Clostridia bacterium]